MQATEQNTEHKPYFRLANLSWLGLTFISVVLDQITKYMANTQLVYNESVPVLPFLNWTLRYNPGAAWSFLADAGGWQRWFFIGLSALVSIVLVFWLMRMDKNMKTLSASLALILSGAIGNNLIDRVLYGHVIDFIHVYYQSWHFPAFNIADSAITLGVILMLIDAFFLEGKRKQSEVT